MFKKSLIALSLFGALFSSAFLSAAPAPSRKPVGLQCDSLVQPLGIDSAQPLLSWRLQDSGRAAAQTAYEIQVAGAAALLSTGKADVWDSGRVASDRSVNVPYSGPALVAQKRYFWRVKVWDKDGHAYPVSDTAWWETGLMNGGWQAKWIGYEENEHRRIRESGARWISNPVPPNPVPHADIRHDFRFHFAAAQPAKRAVLYVTGEDTAAAWINGHQVLEAQPLPPWRQMPWKTYTRHDITSDVHTGDNLLAIGVTRYYLDKTGVAAPDARTPMNACLYLESADGSVQLFTTASEGWKASLNPSGDWYASGYDDSSWQRTEDYASPKATVGHPWPTEPVMMLRHVFQAKSSVVSARLYATALGAYKFHLNGAVVGDQILSPGWMDYRQHVAYQVYNVTRQVRTGNNIIAAYLAPGWYTTPLMWFRQGYNYGNTPPALKAQLRIEHANGSVDWVLTDESWKADISPILSAEIYDGETYDARRVQSGWDGNALFDDAKWNPATVIAPHEPEIVAQYFQPIREEKLLPAKAVTNPKPGVYIYDFGQNMAGVPRVHLQGPAGTDVQLRFAEVLNPDGTMYFDNLRTAKATDHFILAGRGIEAYQPLFTFHGYRYLEISNLPAKPPAGAVQAVVFHTDAPFTAQLETGSPMLNQLWSNILWGQRSNFVGVPTDCPQRDERLGWSADAQVFWRTATYNMDLRDFTQKFSADLRGTQSGTAMYGIFAPGTDNPFSGFGAGWSDAGVIIPWTGWIQTGDTRVVQQNWDAMEKYLAAIQQVNPDYLWRNQFGTPFGDWLTPTQTTPEDLIATAYWAYDVSRMRDMAAALGRTSDVQKYAALFDNIKAAFDKAYVRPDGFVGTVDRFPSIPPPTISAAAALVSKNEPVETQTGYVLALYMNLLPDELRAAAADRLVKKIEENHGLLGTGFLGTPYLLAALADTGHSDVAYKLLLNTSYPSWGYLVGHGATTMWERWNGDQMMNDPSMNSYNHYAYGAVAEWIYRYAAGVDTVPSDAGFHTVYLHPNFDARLGNVNFSYDSPYGRITSAWKITGNQAVWNVTLPPNTKGQLSDKVHILGNNHELAAGTYTFKVAIDR